jgi:signal transduction histidine kinase
MCCPTIEEAMQIQRHNSQQDKFLRTLAESMHQMAQPLSTIQASLELAVLSPTTAAEYKEIAENVLAQLRSAVDSMQFAARLSRFQRPAIDVREISLSFALQEVISSMQRTLDTAEVKLVVRGLEREPLISASPTRLRQMLFYVLQAVQHYSQPGDLAKIEMDGTASRLRLQIQHVAAKTAQIVRPLSPQDEITDRALALADAIVTSDGGTFSVSTSPLLIVADFPLNYESSAAAMDKHKASSLGSSPAVIASHRLSKMS